MGAGQQAGSSDRQPLYPPPAAYAPLARPAAGAGRQAAVTPDGRSPSQTKPRLRAEPKLCRFGSTASSALGSAPNQASSVAAYWSTEVVGIQRPCCSHESTPTSSGPPSASVG